MIQNFSFTVLSCHPFKFHFVFFSGIYCLCWEVSCQTYFCSFEDNAFFLIAFEIFSFISAVLLWLYLGLLLLFYNLAVLEYVGNCLFNFASVPLSFTFSSYAGYFHYIPNIIFLKKLLLLFILSVFSLVMFLTFAFLTHLMVH